jgi:hypothetical protein
MRGSRRGARRVVAVRMLSGFPEEAIMSQKV